MSSFKKNNMKSSVKLHSMQPNFQAISDGLFAYCVVTTDYFPDWALVANYQQGEILDTIQRNPG